MSKGLIDATCEVCGTQFGWFGHMVDRPACPCCSHQLPREVLERQDLEMAEVLARVEKRVAAKNAEKPATERLFGETYR